MTKKISLILSVFMFMFSVGLRADEGMWLLSLLGKNYADMQKAGFKLTPDDIYSVNKSCIKDAVVGLGREGMPFWHFCTGEIVSPEGLMFTNHHCGYGMIQAHSSVEHDYLKDGFWAYSKDQELSNEGITASILIRMEDVTEQIVPQLNDGMTELERSAKVKELSKAIESQAVEGTNYNAKVVDMFGANQYFLFVHVIYKDVRLVGAPPSSMGKFGGDTDNWMWPRHTCDFSMFRIYTAPDGSPATYSADNIPLKPKYYLPVSIKGVDDGDFAMVMGFPGSTDRFLTSYGLAETMNITNKLMYEIRTVKIDVLREEMAANAKTRIQYASKYASCSNYWKYSNEQNKALKRLNTMSVKQGIEAEYTAWAARQTDSKYREALSLLKNAYDNRAEIMRARMYLTEGMLSGPEMPLFALRNANSLPLLDTLPADKAEAYKQKLTENAKTFYKDYNQQTEMKLMAALFEYVHKNLDRKFFPDFFTTVEKKYKGDFTKYVNSLFAKSIFANEAKFMSFLEKPSTKKAVGDPLAVVGNQIYDIYAALSAEGRSSAGDIDKGSRIFIDGIMKMNPGKNLCPDANSTIRCSFGNVKSYVPRDGVFYNYYTTLNGVMQKEDTANYEFVVPNKLKQLYAQKDFGQYADKHGDLPTCFITNNDITGGNSGSPVINAYGQLIGHAFDGNSEAMSGDIDFEEHLQRCINVDIRYTLWVIDKYAGAKNLINEMNIVK